MNCLPLFGAVLAAVSAVQPTEMPSVERSLDARIELLQAQYFRLEAAIDDEIYLIDEVDLVLDELLERGALHSLEFGNRGMRGREDALRRALVSETVAASDAAAELELMLSALPESALDGEIGDGAAALGALREEVDALSPGYSWSVQSKESLMAEAMTGLEEAQVVLRDRKAVLEEEIAFERVRVYQVGADAAGTFVAAAHGKLIESAEPDELARMAERSFDRGLDHLTNAAHAEGIAREIQFRAAERRLAALASSQSSWPGRPSALDHLATTRLALGRLGTAEHALAAIVREHPESTMAARAATDALSLRFELGDYEGVLDGAGEFAAVVPEAEVAYYVGIAALALGDPHTARLALETVGSDSPHAERANLSLAAAVAATGELDLARTMLADLSIEISDRGGANQVRDRAVLSLGLLFFDAGRFSDTVEILKEIPNDSPVATESVLLAAQSLAGVGDVKAARRRLEELRDTSPGTVPALRSLMALAELEMVAGRPDDAERNLDELVSKVANDPRFASLRRHDEQLASLRREAARLERIEAEAQQLQTSALRAGSLSSAHQIGALLPVVRSLSLESRELIAVSADGASSELPSLRKAAEMRLAEIGLMRMESARMELQHLTRGDEPDSTLVLASRNGAKPGANAGEEQ